MNTRELPLHTMRSRPTRRGLLGALGGLAVLLLATESGAAGKSAKKKRKREKSCSGGMCVDSARRGR